MNGGKDTDRADPCSVGGEGSFLWAQHPETLQTHIQYPALNTFKRILPGLSGGPILHSLMPAPKSLELILPAILEQEPNCIAGTGK